MTQNLHYKFRMCTRLLTLPASVQDETIKRLIIGTEYVVGFLAVSRALSRLIVGLRCGAIKHLGAVTEGFGRRLSPRLKYGTYDYWHTRSSDGISTCRCVIKEETKNLIDTTSSFHWVSLRDIENAAARMSRCFNHEETYPLIF